MAELILGHFYIRTKEDEFILIAALLGQPLPPQNHLSSLVPILSFFA